MTTPQAHRVTCDLTPEEKVRLRQQRELIAAELPELIEQDHMRAEARSEPTLSGELRRAIHSSSLPLSRIAEQSSLPPLFLDEFLTGERTLRSDVLDRLATVLGFVLHARE